MLNVNSSIAILRVVEFVWFLRLGLKAYHKTYVINGNKHQIKTKHNILNTL